MSDFKCIKFDFDPVKTAHKTPMGALGGFKESHATGKGRERKCRNDKGWESDGKRKLRCTGGRIRRKEREKVSRNGETKIGISVVL